MIQFLFKYQLEKNKIYLNEDKCRSALKTQCIQCVPKIYVLYVNRETELCIKLN